MLKYVIIALSLFVTIPVFAANVNEIKNERVQLKYTESWPKAIAWQSRLDRLLEGLDVDAVQTALVEPDHPISKALRNRNKYFLDSLTEIHEAPDGKPLDWSNEEHKPYMKKLFLQYLPMLKKEAAYKEIEEEIQQRKQQLSK